MFAKIWGTGKTLNQTPTVYTFLEWETDHTLMNQLTVKLFSIYASF